MPQLVPQLLHTVSLFVAQFEYSHFPLVLSHEEHAELGQESAVYTSTYTNKLANMISFTPGV